MANYHLCVHPNVSRGKGQSLVRTAAYNARARLTDERTGKVWDYRHLGAVLFEGIYAAKAPNWARDLGQLVNGVERSEKRCDAQLALNIDIALPHEQTLEQSRRLLQDFVREQFMRAGYAAHAAIHPPEPGGDPRNIHAHVLVTLRQIGPDGFAPTKAEQQERYRNRSAFVEQLREKWEQLANRHLARNGIDARIDRRSLKEQGIDGKPPQHRGPAVTAIQRRSQVEALGPASCDQQAAHAAQEPLPAEPERIAVLPPPAAAQMEISIGGGENSHAIEDLPIGMSIAIEDDPHVDRNTAGPKRGIPTYPPLAENVPAAITTRPIIAAEGGISRNQGLRRRTDRSAVSACCHSTDVAGSGLINHARRFTRCDQEALPRGGESRAASCRTGTAAEAAPSQGRNRRRVPPPGAALFTPHRHAAGISATRFDHQPLSHNPGGRVRHGDSAPGRHAHQPG